MAIETNRLLAFSELIYSFERVERADIIPGTERFEDDAAHSFHLAMLAWYIASVYKLDLDQDLLRKYALVHDLVEAYAGDTFVYSKDAASHASKHEREARAQARMRTEFPEFTEMHDLIEQYERRPDTESVFIYVLDKIIPILVCYADKGRAWKKWDIDVETVARLKRDKVRDHPELRPVLEDMLAILEQEKELLFNKQ